MRDRKLENGDGFKLYIVMGLIFLGFGTGFSYNGLSMLLPYFQSADWEKTPASIVAVELKTYRSDGKYLYSVECEYTYLREGRRYTGTRVGFEKYNSSDPFHKVRHGILLRFEKSGELFPALVNPGNPGESVLFRELQTTVPVSSMAGILFAMGGVFLLVRGIVAWRESYAKSRLYPGKAWKADRISDGFVVSDNALLHVFGAFGVGVGMGLFVAIHFVAFSDGESMPLLPMIVLGVFPLATKKTIFEDRTVAAKSMERSKGKSWTFAFAVPEGYPDRSLSGSTKYRWVLEAKAETPGIDFGATFQLPVYSVSDQSDIRRNPLYLTDELPETER